MIGKVENADHIDKCLGGNPRNAALGGSTVTAQGTLKKEARTIPHQLAVQQCGDLL